MPLSHTQTGFGRDCVKRIQIYTMPLSHNLVLRKPGIPWFWCKIRLLCEESLFPHGYPGSNIKVEL